MKENTFLKSLRSGDIGEIENAEAKLFCKGLALVCVVLLVFATVGGALGYTIGANSANEELEVMRKKYMSAEESNEFKRQMIEHYYDAMKIIRVRYENWVMDGVDPDTDPETYEQSREFENHMSIIDDMWKECQ